MMRSQTSAPRRSGALTGLLTAALLAGLSSVATAEPAPPNPTHAHPCRAALVPYIEAALDPGSRLVLDKIAASKAPPPWTLPPKQLRERFDAFFGAFSLPPADLDTRTSRSIAGPHGPIPVHVFRPKDAGAGPLPALVYYHGGGMMTNSTDTYDAMLQHIVAPSGVAIVSVDYRLAPEHRFPKGLDDAYAAVRWVAANAASIDVDAKRLAIGGDSAGGYLTGAVTQLVRDRGGPALRYQVMIYPAVGAGGNARSVDLYSQGYFFSKEELAWTYAQYVDDAAAFADPRVQPILAKDFARLPPALVIVAEYDILRDDGEEYAGRLKAAGVPVDLHRYPGTIHGFFNIGGTIAAGREAIAEIAAKLKAALVPPK